MTNYSHTLNLPKTEFPMKANLSTRELDILNIWQKCDLYSSLRSHRKGNKKFVLHDGPPYANGHAHIGTVFNKVLKDITVKAKNMEGYDAPFVPGWDCHGLPIEYNVMKTIKANASASEIRLECRKSAQSFIDFQKQEFQRLGIMADWQKPYLTMNNHFEAQIVEELYKFIKNGSLTKGLKPVHWCTTCETALAQAELEYSEHRSVAVYVRFPVKDVAKFYAMLGKDCADTPVSFVAWTTTPWTLPANVALCLHPEYKYVVASANDALFVVAAEMLVPFCKECSLDVTPLFFFYGKEVEHLKCQHPFLQRDSVVVLGEHVNLLQGTGVIHTAPGHGEEDFVVGKKYNLNILSPVDNKGFFTKDVPLFSGKKVEEVNTLVVSILKENNTLLKQHHVKHEYPHCWRCHFPVVVRATEQWFISMVQNDLRSNAIEATKKVMWIPKWGQKRLTDMLQTRPDWCVSRQRFWGVPIAIFRCKSCSQKAVNDILINHVVSLFEEHSSDIWFTKSSNELLPKDYTCSYCGNSDFEKENDILDVWFDSGTTQETVLAQHEDLHYPADLYLEGSDQFRGWFQSSLLLAVGTGKQQPYQQVATHGYVLLESATKELVKASKSKGNSFPIEMVEKYGADLIRLWIASEDFRDDVVFSVEKITHMQSQYRKIRNTYRYLLGNLFDWQQQDMAYENFDSLEKYVLHRLAETNKNIREAYSNYEYHVVFQLLQNFSTNDLSALYFDVRKDLLYTSKNDAPMRRQVQFVLSEILYTSLPWIAPILSFTAEEIWQNVRCQDDVKSIHLKTFKELSSEYTNKKVAQDWKSLLQTRTEILKILEACKNDKKIAHFREIEIVFSEELQTLENYFPLLQNILLVSKIRSGNESENSFPVTVMNIPGKMWIQKIRGKKCQRCWFYFEEPMEDEVFPGACEKCTFTMSAM